MDTQSKPARRTMSVSSRSQAQLGMLVTMFLLGMAVNLIGLPTEASGTAKTASTIFLVLHGLLGIGLVINAVVIIRLATKAHSALTKQAQIGAGVIILTFIAGIITNATKNNWWSYAMAVGFAASLPIYGLLLLRSQTKQS